MQLSKLKNYITLGFCLLSLTGCGQESKREILEISVYGFPPCGAVYTIPVSAFQEIRINGQKGPVTIGGSESEKGGISLKGEIGIKKLQELQQGGSFSIPMGNFTDSDGKITDWSYEIRFDEDGKPYPRTNLVAETVCIRGKER